MIGKLPVGVTGSVEKIRTDLQHSAATRGAAQPI
jgi:hypothetical protein